jgi:hypothetical protein
MDWFFLNKNSREMNIGLLCVRDKEREREDEGKWI